ncbi:MAG: filamentous hemagglutinin N-terminal domain-containing protein [Rhizomicrobium sp.]
MLAAIRAPGGRKYDRQSQRRRQPEYGGPLQRDPDLECRNTFGAAWPSSPPEQRSAFETIHYDQENSGEGYMMSMALLRRRLLSASALVSVLAVPLATANAMAGGLPNGGHYVAGDGTINKAAQTLTVKQSSTTGIVDWSNFSIGSKSAVTFDNGNGATLNRVTGGNLSKIAGSLSATGSLYVINSRGVIVSASGRVVTGGSFVATSATGSNSAFENDRFKPGNGGVVNRGTIAASGSVTLTGTRVVDTGAIRASQVQLHARRGLAIRGAIVAQDADGAGGTIVATAKRIAVAGTANISANGTRGGTVLIGGDIHGGAIQSDNFVKQTIAAAKTTRIAQGAQISASASKGAGGNIVIWSDGHTSFDGTIDAQGQTRGGFAEVSSHILLGFTGTVNLTSASGKTGTLLLDPENVVISDDATASGSISADKFSPSGANSVLNVGTLETALNSANIQITTGASGSQTGDIAVIDPVTWSANTLTLDAYHSIIIGASVSAEGTANLTLKTDDGGTGGSLLFATGGNIDFASTSQTLIINGAIYTLVDSISQLASDITGNASGNYALANSYDASGDNGGDAYTSSPITPALTGTFEGLGNTISNLHIDDNADSDVGLFADNGGTIRDLTLSHVQIASNATVADVGALAGTSSGQVIGVSETGGSVTGAGNPTNVAVNVGGLVGANGGTINRSSATAGVYAGANAEAGGLVGYNSGTIENSSAGGAVSVDPGGTSSVAAWGGGLLGFAHAGSTVETSFATGSVTDGGSKDAIGGFVGSDQGGTLTQSYATGAVSGYGAVGGFVGFMAGGTALTNSYALGPVTGLAGSEVGGFVGVNDTTITDSYSAGAVSSSSTVTGGFAGENSGTLTGVYYASSAGPSQGIGSGSGTATGLTAAQMVSKSSFSGWTFGTTPGASGWVIVDVDGGFNNSGYDGVTFPMLESEATATGAAHFIQNAHQLELAGLDPSGDYFLAENIDASATGTGTDVWGSTGFVTVGGATGFSGSFYGLGHAIDGLYVNGGNESYVGLFSILSGTVEDLNLTDASVSGTDLGAGILAGENTGVITRTSTSGVVLGGADTAGGLVGNNNGGSIAFSNSSAAISAGPSSAAGGLVGEIQSGTVTSSYATGSVTAVTNSEGALGGLAGANAGSIVSDFATGSVSGGNFAGGLVGYNTGSVTTSFAAGAVTDGQGSQIGGLVGALNGGTIVSSYATGYLSGVGAVGGLVGYDSSDDNITTSYWDTQTSGIAATHGVGDTANASGVTGKTTTKLQKALLTGFNSGTWGIVAAKSFPYLRWQTPNGGTPQIISGTITGGTTDAGLQVNAYADDTAGDTLVAYSSGANGHYIILLAPGSISPSGTSVVTYIDDQTNQGWNYYQDRKSSLTDLVLEVGTSKIETDQTTLSAVNEGLYDALAGIEGSDIPNSAVTTIELDLSASNFDFDEELTAPTTLIINSAHTVTQDTDPDAAIGAPNLLLKGGGDMELENLYNAINTVAADNSAGQIAVASHDTLTIGAVDSVEGVTSASSYFATTSPGTNLIVDAPVTSPDYIQLSAQGTITQSSSGILTSGVLEVFSGGATTLNAANVFGELESSSADGLALTDAASLSVSDVITAQSGTLTLKTTGSGHNLAIEGSLTGQTVDLISPGTISESGSGAIDANTLTGSSHGAVTLNGSNHITDLGALTIRGGSFSLTDDHDMTTTGKIDAGSHTIKLTTTGRKHDIAIDSKLEGGAIDFVSAATISENVSGDIDAKKLTGIAHGTVKLTSAGNTVTDLSAFTTNGNHTFELTDDHALTVDSQVNAGTGTLDLTAIGTDHSLSIDGTITGGTINLVTSGEATESSSKGSILASKLLNVTAGTGIVLTSKLNKIKKLGTDKTQTGLNKVTL